jgi:hypothetical protein
MPSSRLDSLAEGRANLTGERHEQALMALRQLGRKASPIPDAESEAQASLEARLLEQLGRSGHHQYWSPKVPFMVTSVTPEPDKLTIRVPEEYLPDVIRDVFPYWVIEDDGSKSDVYGIAGLRYRLDRGRVIMARLGRPGRVCMPVKAGMWEKACRVAMDSLGDGFQFRFPWRTSPTERDPAENQAWPPDDGVTRTNNHFVSQIFRRLPGLCPSSRAEWHDLWINWRGDRCDINLEWMNGTSHAEVLELLLDPRFSPRAQIDPNGTTRKTVDGCYSLTAGWVTVRSELQPTAAIALRRLRNVYSADHDIEFMCNEDVKLRAERAAIEAKHSYRVRRPRSLQAR